jgi:hypothetical protein
MFTLASTADYSNSWKFHLFSFLKGKEIKKEISQNKDFKDIFEKYDIVEKLLVEINKDFYEISSKYKLLFSLKDYESLFKDENFKKEIILYVKYKESER